MFRIRKAYDETIDVITKTYKRTISILEEQVSLAGETNTILKNENKTLRDSNELLQQTVDLLKEVERTPEVNTEYEDEIAQLKTEIMEQGKTIERLEGEKAKLQDVVEKLNEESKKSPAHISSEQLAELKRLKRNEYQRKWLARQRKKNATENVHQL